MIAVEILEASDTLQATDWCRPLALQTMLGGLSESYSFENCYNGSPENNTRWAQASEVFPRWIGRPLSEMQTMLGKFNRPYEFVRGPVPKNHVLPSRNRRRA